jgi:hypothetical protein
VNTLITLYYTVLEPPVIERCPQADAFYQGNPAWLYEELDVLAPGVFLQEILLSTGRIVKIRFRDFRFEIAPMVGPIRDKGVKGPAEEGRAASA